MNAPRFPWPLDKRTIQSVANWISPVGGWSSSKGVLQTLSVDAGGALITSSSAGVAVTPTIAAVGASGSGSIPLGAKGWTFTVLTGTATFGGVTVSAGFSDSDNNTLAATIAYTTASGSSAYVRYNS